MRLRLALGLICCTLAVCSALPAVEPLERSAYLMGTSLKITIFASDRPSALAQSESVLRIVEEAENQLSNWREWTELSAINRQPPDLPIQLSSYMCDLLGRLSAWVARTKRTFDPSVGRLVQAHGIQSSGRVASAGELELALSRSGFDHLLLSGCSLTKTANVLLDSGAFGKGEALDLVLAAARQGDYSPFLIDFGGQLVSWKQPPAEDGWDAWLADPVDRASATGDLLRISEGSLSTSGGSEKDLIVDGKRIGHILDPRTGQPAPAFGSVTVWHPSALAADILSTALYVMGPDVGFRWAVEQDVAACFLTIDPAAAKPTPAFERLRRPGR